MPGRDQIHNTGSISYATRFVVTSARIRKETITVHIFHCCTKDTQKYSSSQYIVKCYQCKSFGSVQVMEHNNKAFKGRALAQLNTELNFWNVWKTIFADQRLINIMENAGTWELRVNGINNWIEGCVNHLMVENYVKNKHKHKAFVSWVKEKEIYLWNASKLNREYLISKQLTVELCICIWGYHNYPP